MAFQNGFAVDYPNRRVTRAAMGNKSLPIPLFEAPLLSSLVPAKGTGTYTFSRSTIANALDFEGVLRTCPINCARFSNARCVINMLRNVNARSNAINDGVWQTSSGTETINGPNQYTETVGGVNVGIRTTNLLTGQAIQNRVFTISFSAYKVSGTSFNYKVRLLGDVSSVASTTFTLTGALKRYSVTLTMTPGADTAVEVRFGAGVNEAGRVIHIENIMIEEVTGQGIQTASEYVSYGEGGDTGSGVDGVKWFNTSNGNTVSSFVMTEATGTLLGSKGYLSEQEKTNLVFPSEDFTGGGWTKNNVVTAVSTATFVAGNTAASSIKASSTSNVTHSISQTVTTTVVDQDLACAFFITTGGTQTHAFIRISKGAESAAQFFNVSTGAVESAINSGGTISVVSGTAKTHVAAQGGYWCHVIINGASTTGVHTIEFGISNADGVVSYAAANTTDVLLYLTGCQVQYDHEIGEYIKTVSGTVTKAGDSLAYDVANIPGEEFSMVAECEVETPCTSICTIMMIQDATQTANYSIGGRNTDRFQASCFDLNGIQVYRAQSGSIAVGHHKGGATFSRHAGQRLSAVNGILVNSNPIDIEDSTSWSPASFTISCNASGTGQSDFSISHAKVYSKLNALQLQDVTS